MLQVISLHDIHIKPSGGRVKRYLCKCDCGNYHIVSGESLVSGKTKSCGCLKRMKGKARKNTHPYVHTRLYRVWGNMVNRCTNHNNPAYNKYGGRGISVCDEWLQFLTFREWAISSGYSEELSIDRIDNDGGYNPDNCRWVDRYVQANNKRNNVMLEFNGRTMTVSEWAREMNINYKALHRRLHAGWTVERALTEPLHNSSS